MDYSSNKPEDKETKETNEDKPSKDIQKVVTGEVIQKQKTFGSKFKEVFFGGDFKMTMRYLAGDVLLPAARNLIVDATTKGIERAVYGDTPYRRGGSSNVYRPRIQYDSRYSSNPLRPDPRAPIMLPDQPPRRPHPTRDFNEIILQTREDAEAVVDQMVEILSKYDSASLADLYETLGLPSAHTDNKWGWKYLGKVNIQQVRQGYLVQFPAIEEL